MDRSGGYEPTAGLPELTQALISAAQAVAQAASAAASSSTAAAAAGEGADGGVLKKDLAKLIPQPSVFSPPQTVSRR